jgi:hypothetical protein
MVLLVKLKNMGRDTETAKAERQSYRTSGDEGDAPMRTATLKSDSKSEEIYRVECIGEDEDVEVTIFAGHNALTRAIRYAAGEHDQWADPQGLSDERHGVDGGGPA